MLGIRFNPHLTWCKNLRMIIGFYNLWVFLKTKYVQWAYFKLIYEFSFKKLYIWWAYFKLIYGLIIHGLYPKFFLKKGGVKLTLVICIITQKPMENQNDTHTPLTCWLTVDHLLTTVSLSLTRCNIVFLIQYSLKQIQIKKKTFFKK